MIDDGLTAEIEFSKSAPTLSIDEIDKKFQILCAQPNADNMDQKQEALDELLEETSDPHAQLVALVSIIHHDPIVRMGQKNLARVKFTTIQDELGLSTQQCQDIEKQVHLFKEESESLHQADEGIIIYEGSKPIQERKNEITVEINKLLLDVRKGLLNNPVIPDEYKIQVISGLTYPVIDTYKLASALYPIALKCDRQIDDTLSQLYNDPDTSTEIKKTIAKTAKERLAKDLYALEIVSLKDYPEFGIDPEEVFARAFSNQYTTGEYIESTLAPMFLPEEDPQKVKAAWECLRQASWELDPSLNHHTVYFNGSNSEVVNRAYFKDFLNH